MSITVGWGFMDILKEVKYHNVADVKILLLGRQMVFMLHRRLYQNFNEKNE